MNEPHFRPWSEVTKITFVVFKITSKHVFNHQNIFQLYENLPLVMVELETRLNRSKYTLELICWFWSQAEQISKLL